MNGLLTDTGRAVAFLSRLPVPDRFFDGETGAISDTARSFPLAGVVIALPASAVLLVILAAGVPHLFASTIALVVLLLVTGALHEDGLADCTDGFGGGSNRQRVLDIMKDSAVGAYGAIAVMMSLMLRVTGIAAVADAATPWAAALAVGGVAVVSRSAMVWHWHVLPGARTDGVANAAGRPDGGRTWFALVSGAILGAFLVAPAAGIFGIVMVLATTSVACLGFTGLVRRRIQGHTGDTIGATQQVCEVAALLGLALSL